MNIYPILSQPIDYLAYVTYSDCQCPFKISDSGLSYPCYLDLSSKTCALPLTYGLEKSIKCTGHKAQKHLIVLLDCEYQMLL